MPLREAAKPEMGEVESWTRNLGFARWPIVPVFWTRSPITSLYPRTAVDFADFVVQGGTQARDFDLLAYHHQQLIWRSGRDDKAFIYFDRD